MFFDDLGYKESTSYYSNEEEGDYSLEAAWLDWLEENDCEYPRLAQELDVEMPRLLPMLVPVEGSMGIKTALWCFYMDVELRFLCSLPDYKRTATSLKAIDGCLVAGGELEVNQDTLSHDEISIFASKMLSTLMDSQMFLDDSNWWASCGILEQLDLWPRDAVEWMIWLTKVCRFVQNEANGQRLRLCLEMLQTKLEDNSLEDFWLYDMPEDTRRQRQYMQNVIIAVQKFIDECSWSLPYFSEISVKEQ